MTKQVNSKIGKIRYYKGIVKVKIISDSTPNNTMMYKAMENGLHFKKNQEFIAPFRLCWLKRKYVKQNVINSIELDSNQQLRNELRDVLKCERCNNDSDGLLTVKVEIPNRINKKVEEMKMCFYCVRLMKSYIQWKGTFWSSIFNIVME